MCVCERERERETERERHTHAHTHTHREREREREREIASVPAVRVDEDGTAPLWNSPRSQTVITSALCGRQMYDLL